MNLSDRLDAKTRILVRMHDETVQPDGYVAMRCTEHGRFIVWVWACAPDCRIGCPPECGSQSPQDGPSLHVVT